MSSTEIRDLSIRRRAGRLRLAIIAAMVVLASAILLAWFGAPLGIARVEMREHGTTVDPRITGTLSVLLTEIALFRLTQMLGAIESGDLFSARVIRHFRGFAFWLLVVALGGILGPLVLSLAESSGDRVTLVFNLTKILAVGVTLVLFLLARLLERARQLDEEMREIV